MIRLNILCAAIIWALFGAPAHAATLREAQLACLDDFAIQSEIATSAGMLVVRARCRSELALAIADWKLSPLQEDAVLATFVAHRSAPYAGSVAVSREMLVREPGLDCDNYAMLTEYLLRDMHTNARLVFMGLDGGRIGNHAQALVVHDGSTLLLDPTIGLVARVSFDALLMGTPVAPEDILVDARVPESAISGLKANVEASLLQGAYRPSHLLYYLEGNESMIAFSDHAGPYWAPEQHDLLLLHYPTPAAGALRRNLRGGN